MPRRSYPLLDIDRALHDADASLADVLAYLEMLDLGGDAQRYPGTATLHGNIRAVRALLGMAVPAPFAACIAREQTDFEAGEQYCMQVPR